MANGFLEPIRLHPRPRGLWLFTVFTVTAALMAVAVTALTLPVKALVAAAVLLMVVVQWRGRLWSGRGCEVCAALSGADGRWRIGVVSGAWIDARLLRCWGTALGPVIALQWVDVDGRSHHAWLLKREATAQVWRRLRVRLRMA